MPATNTLGSLVLEFGANLAKLQADMGKATRVVEGGVNSIRRAANFARTALAGIGVGLSGAAFAASVKNVIDLGDSLRDLSFATDQSVEQLSFLDFVAGQSGTSIQAITTASQRLAKNLVDVANGGGEKAARALRTLGLSAQELSKLNLTGQFGAIGDALNKLDNPAQRAAVATDLIGKGYKQLAPFIRGGREELEKLLDQFVSLGGTISTQQGEMFDEFNDSLGALRLAARSASEAVATALAPALTDFFNSFATVTANIGPFMTDLFFAMREGFLDVARAAVISKRDFLDMINVFGIFDDKVAAANKRIAELSDEIKRNNEARDDAIIGRMLDRQEEKAKVNRQGDPSAILVDPEAGAEEAAKEAERLAKEFKKESDAVRAFLQDYAREREREYQAEVERLRDRREQLLESIRTPREKALRDLAEFAQVFGADSAEYGKAAVKAFEELEDSTDIVSENVKTLQEAGEDMGLTFSSALEDAIVNFESLGDIIKGLTQDILRMTIRLMVIKPLMKAIRGAFSSSFAGGSGGGGGIFEFFKGMFGGARAAGGPVSAGKAYLVGERGPEILVPGFSGTIVPNSMGGGVTIINNSPVPLTGKDRGSVGGQRQIELGVLNALSGAVAGGSASRELGLNPKLVSR